MAQQPEQPLQPLLLDRYRLMRQVSRCGETVVWLGEEIASGEHVTVREFFAETIMSRRADGSLAVRPGREVQYKSLTSDYEELCRSIMGLTGLRGLICPEDVFWSRGTVYSVERYVEAQTLDDYLARRGEPMSWLQLKKAIAPVVQAVTRLHGEGIYHRGISPETILVDEKENFLLSGCCIPAARTADSEIASTLYFGYSAPEQYASNSWQGSWSDVYSLAAVCYRALTGTTPVEWKQRGNGRELIPARAIRGEVPENISNALMTALSVDLRNRYRTVDEFWIGLLHGPGDGTAVYQLPMEGHTPPPTAAVHRNGPFLALMITLVMLLVAVLSINLLQILIGPREPTAPGSAAPVEPTVSEPVSESAESLPAVAPAMPDFLGMSVERVFQSYSAQFAFDINYIYSEKEAFEVVGQRPKAGEPVTPEQRVLLDISKGSERTAMPQVIGLPLEEAQELLEAQDIAYQVEVIVDPAHEDGVVVGASHEYGSILYRSTETVTIRVARHL